VWNAPSTDSRRIALLSVLTAVLLVSGTSGATARSWLSLEELDERSGSARYDTAPPSAPTALALTRVTRSALSLEWEPASDDRRLWAYALYREGTYVGAAWRTSDTVRGLACGRTYRIGVAALDYGGNRSESANINASTRPCQDTTRSKPVSKPRPDAPGAGRSRPVPPKTPPSPPPPALTPAASSGSGSPQSPSSTLFKNTQSTGDIDCCNNIAGGEGYGVVILAPWMHPDAARYEAAGTRTLLYKDASSFRQYGCGHAIQPTGVRCEDFRPEWFLHDSGGQRCEWSGYTDHWQVDVGNPAYQAKWADTVIAEARQYGYKGITIDNANMDLSVYCGGRTFPKYPTQAAQAEAMRGFLAHVGPRLKAAGLLVVPNIQSHGNPAVALAAWRDWLPYLTGGVDEHFLRWPGANALFGGQAWLDEIAVFEEAQRQGRTWHGGTDSSGAIGPQAQRYGRASFFVGWKGQTGATFAGGTANQEWRIEIGKPVEERRLYATDVWGKRYDGGLALVNIGPASQTISLGGTYRHPNGQLVSSVTLAARDGLVLRLP
jgi:Hypothetical glycosyl hydrolase family 15